MPDDIDPVEPDPRLRPDGDGPPDPRTEQAVRSAMRARADSVTPTSLHRPTYPERRNSRIRPMLLAAAAVVAVGGLVVGITLATHRGADEATAPLNPTAVATASRVTASAESSSVDLSSTAVAAESAVGSATATAQTTASQAGLDQIEGVHWILDSFTAGGRTTDTRAFPAASFEISSSLIGWDYTCGGGTFHYSAVGTTVTIGAFAGMIPHTCSQVPPGQGPKAISALFDAATFTVSASGATLTVTSPAQTLIFHKDGAARLYWADS